MKDHFSALNASWEPAILWGAWLNAKRSSSIHEPRSSASWSDHVAITTKLIVLHLLRVLIAAGTPLFRAFSYALCVYGNVASVSMWMKRLVADLVGWQGQKISRTGRDVFGVGIFRELRRWHVTLGLVLACGAFIRLLKLISMLFSHSAWRLRSLEKRMENASTYDEWYNCALDIDAIKDEQMDPASREQLHFDVNLLKAKTSELQYLRNTGNTEELACSLRADLIRDFGNISNRDIYAHRHILPKQIEDYISTVHSCLEFLADCDSSGLHEKITFFEEVRHAFGRTALVLSGGGALGAFHLGIVRGLMTNGLLPRIIAGSSVGSIVAAIAAVHTDDELLTLYSDISNVNLSFFAHDSAMGAMLHLLQKGTLQDVNFLVDRLRNMLADITFLEAYQRTNRFLNVTVTAADTNEPPRILNYLTAPNVVIWSAVACSSAFPGLFPAQELWALDTRGNFFRHGRSAASDAEGGHSFPDSVQRRWHDGSLENDLPFKQLSEMFNVNHFIVSQTNPHLVPLMSLKNVVSGPLFNLLQAEVKHFFLQAQQYLPAWIPTKWMRLFTQPWEGHVTILLPWHLYRRNIGRAIHNPSPADLELADKEGHRAAWEHMSAMQANCSIELKLDECLSGLIDLARSEPTSCTTSRPSFFNPHSSRIPSWSHLPQLPAFTASVRFRSHDGTRSLSDYTRDEAMLAVSQEGGN